MYSLSPFIIVVGVAVVINGTDLLRLRNQTLP